MRMIFVNLPVKDLVKSKEFFSALGFSYNPAFTNDDAACMIVEENIYVMLLTHGHFRQFIDGEIADTSKGKEVLTCLSAGSRAEVDDYLKKALAAGGSPGSRYSTWGRCTGAASRISMVMSGKSCTWTCLRPAERAFHRLSRTSGGQDPASGSASLTFP